MTKTLPVVLTFTLGLAALVGLAACKPRKTDAVIKSDETEAAADPSVTSGLKDFGPEPTGQFTRKLAARLAAADVPAAGCAHAARYVVTGSPGRKKTSWKQFRGDLVDSLKAVATGGLMSWDKLEEWVTLPTYTFMACKGAADYPKLDEAPRELLGTIKAHARTLKENGLRQVFVIATAEDAEITEGLMGAVKAELAKSPDTPVKEIKLKGAAGLDPATQEAQAAFGAGIGDGDALVIWAYGMAGPIVLNAMAGDAEAAVKLRNRTNLLMTVASPMGGALPALVADAQVKKAFDRVAGHLNVIGVKTMEDAAYKAVMRPAEWLSPQARAAYLTGTLKTASFALSRNDAQKRSMGEKLEIAQVAGVQDPANLRFLPRLSSDDGGTKLGAGDLANQLLMPIYQRFPLSDGMVALEHAVIPPGAVPAGVDARLTAVLRLGHFDMAFAMPDTSTQYGRDINKISEVPSFAIVDALVASAFHAIDTNEVAEIEPPYDPAAEQKKRVDDYAAANGYVIRSKYGGRCLDVPDINGAILYSHPCHMGQNQRFFLDKVDGNVSFRSAANPQKCVDTHTGNNEKKTGYVYMSPCHLHYNQTYSFGRQPNPVEPAQGMGYVEIHNGLYGNAKCLDIDYGNAKSPNGNANGRRVYFAPQCHGGDNQQWMIDVAMP